MKTTARQTTALIASGTVVLAALVIAALLEQYDECEICERRVADLYDRLTEDGNEVRACECCVDAYRLAYVAD